MPNDEPKPSDVTARSRRPVFSGQRLTVFDWMVDDLLKLLGPHAEAFDLHEWFFTLDRRCVTRGEIPPIRDSGVWLKAVTLAEAQRRGLPVREASLEKPPRTAEVEDWGTQQKRDLRRRFGEDS